MTPREKFQMALDGRQPPGRVPHFELVFFLTMEAFGKVHPTHRSYHQWDQMEEKERQLHRQDMAQLYIDTARHYEHSAIFLHLPSQLEKPDEYRRLIEVVREQSGRDFFLVKHGDATLKLKNIEQLVYRIADDPEGVHRDARSMVDRALMEAESLMGSGLDGFALCSDYCFNNGPFLSPSQFSEFITPYLDRLIRGYRQMGLYTIKHTDGNIMPILDQLVQCKPHALHSLDPQGGVDIAEVKRKYGRQVCLIGNVNCGLLDTGTDEQCVASARYALKHGMPGGGYIFSTSNCIYTGMRLSRYELILDVWRNEGCYNH
ncbi:MAG: uroporphyrinogen decarboxylase family protein [Phycisphaerae bacterium]